MHRFLSRKPPKLNYPTLNKLEGLLTVNRAFVDKGVTKTSEEQIWNGAINKFNERLADGEVVTGDFGTKVSEYEKRLGVKQNTIADRIGLTASHFNRIVHGLRKPPQVEKVLSLVENLMLTPDEAVELVHLAGYSPTTLIKTPLGPMGRTYPQPTLQEPHQ